MGRKRNPQGKVNAMKIFADDRLVYPRRQRRGDFGAGAAAAAFGPRARCARADAGRGAARLAGGRRLGGRLGRRRGDLPRRAAAHAGCSRRRARAGGLGAGCRTFAVRVQHLPAGKAHRPGVRRAAFAHLPHGIRGLHPLLFAQPPLGPRRRARLHAAHRRRVRRLHRPHGQGRAPAGKLRRRLPRAHAAHRHRHRPLCPR